MSTVLNGAGGSASNSRAPRLAASVAMGACGASASSAVTDASGCVSGDEDSVAVAGPGAGGLDRSGFPRPVWSADSPFAVGAWSDSVVNCVVERVGTGLGDGACRSTTDPGARSELPRYAPGAAGAELSSGGEYPVDIESGVDG